jgi:hypothetical protein
LVDSENLKEENAHESIREAIREALYAGKTLRLMQLSKIV